MIGEGREEGEGEHSDKNVATSETASGDRKTAFIEIIIVNI